MRKLLFNYAFKAITKLFKASIKNEKAETIVLLLFSIVVDIVDRLTDDDRDNTKQVVEYINSDLPVILTQIVKAADE